jgi:predicted small integral membrane protein
MSEARKSDGMWRSMGIALAVLAAVAGLLIWAAPREDGAVSWTAPMIPQGWMAWTLATAFFFWGIAAALTVMTIYTAYRTGAERTGLFRFPTTPGDRLFVSLLGSAYICLAWLAIFGSPLWGAVVICILWAVGVFRLV